MDKNLLLQFQDKNIGKLYIYYEDNKLCLMKDNYNFDNNHRITRKSKLFIPMKKLLGELRKNDAMRNFSFNKFEWVSDGYGMPEARNRLVIYELENIIIMNFIKNKYNTFDDSDTCVIRFSMTEEKNKPIIRALNQMHVDLYSENSMNKNSLLK